MIARGGEGGSGGVSPRQLVYAPRALKDISKLPKDMQQKVVEALDLFAASGHGDLKKMIDVRPPTYRMRVGDWRVRLALNAGMVEVLHVRHRREAY